VTIGEWPDTRRRRQGIADAVLGCTSATQMCRRCVRTAANGVSERVKATTKPLVTALRISRRCDVPCAAGLRPRVTDRAANALFRACFYCLPFLANFRTSTGCDISAVSRSSGCVGASAWRLIYERSLLATHASSGTGQVPAGNPDPTEEDDHKGPYEFAGTRFGKALR
jgi:hypothetical protein